MSLLRRTGPFAGPVRLFCLLFLSLLPLQVGAGAGGRRPRVRDSILGVRLGSSLEDARRRLDPLAIHRPRKSREGEKEEGREEGRKMAWSLRRTEYQSIALAVDGAERVVWITGFVRLGKEIPFSRLGDLSIAQVTDSSAIWNVATPGGNYQLAARGHAGKARVISLISFPSSANPG